MIYLLKIIYWRKNYSEKQKSQSEKKTKQRKQWKQARKIHNYVQMM